MHLFLQNTWLGEERCVHFGHCCFLRTWQIGSCRNICSMNKCPAEPAVKCPLLRLNMCLTAMPTTAHGCDLGTKSGSFCLWEPVWYHKPGICDFWRQKSSHPHVSPATAGTSSMSSQEKCHFRLSSAIISSKRKIYSNVVHHSSFLASF